VIITRTPLRISFAGGGTDLPSFYRFTLMIPQNRIEQDSPIGE